MLKLYISHSNEPLPTKFLKYNNFYQLFTLIIQPLILGRRYTRWHWLKLKEIITILEQKLKWIQWEKKIMALPHTSIIDWYLFLIGSCFFFFLFGISFSDNSSRIDCSSLYFVSYSDCQVLYFDYIFLFSTQL